MTIKVTLNLINKEDIEKILYYYNELKTNNDEYLDTIICKEGGFQLLPYNKNNLFKYNSKQLRWNNKYLVSYSNYNQFNKEEENLLFKVLRLVLGKENVLFYNSYSDALLSSPSIQKRIKNSPKKSPKCSPTIINSIHRLAI